MTAAAHTCRSRTVVLIAAAVVDLSLVGVVTASATDTGPVHGCTAPDGTAIGPASTDRALRPCTDRETPIPPGGRSGGEGGWYRAGQAADVPPYATQRLRATCPEGRVLTGGGHGTGAGLVVRSSHAEDARTWVLSVRNTTGGPSRAFVQAFCVEGPT